MSDKKYPKVVVGILIYDDAGQILLGKSHKWADQWVVFGGHVEWGETLLDAVRREAKEETNLDIENIELISIQESIFPAEFAEPKHMIFMNYAARMVAGDLHLNNEVQEYVWIEPQKALAEVNLNASSREFIQSFIKKTL